MRHIITTEILRCRIKEGIHRRYVGPVEGLAETRVCLFLAGTMLHPLERDFDQRLKLRSEPALALIYFRWPLGLYQDTDLCLKFCYLSVKCQQILQQLSSHTRTLGSARSSVTNETGICNNRRQKHGANYELFTVMLFAGGK